MIIPVRMRGDPEFPYKIYKIRSIYNLRCLIFIAQFLETSMTVAHQTVKIFT